MPKKKNVMIDYTSRDFDTIKAELVDHAKRYYNNAYKDFTVASFGGMVLDSVAYVGDMLSYYVDYNANEQFLDTAVEFDNIRKHASALGYNFEGVASSYGVMSLFVVVPSNAEGTAPDTSYLPTVLKGASFSSGVGNFILTEDVMFNSADSEYVAARFDADTGATTHFAVKATGQVQSGVIGFSEADLRGSAFEKFKRIRIGPPSITEVLNVFDSEGNKYHEVENLAQETVFVETTNKDAIKDGVRSIIKPYVASRRYVVHRDDTGTYLQFGFGSSDEDSSGLADPAKIALKMHGRTAISNTSFDPTNLLSTNKLGISPYNTILNITHRTNVASATAVSAETISSVTSVEMFFPNRTSLDQVKLSDVEGSLECNNEQAITSPSIDITVEELKQRAKAHYATQNRAVTKQDYESLCYNMPPKFGAIKRANIINDPSATNRRMMLYVTSQNSDGHLAHANSVVKNNLKNWLSHYKMLNDVIDIHDAKIVNFAVDFSVMVDKTYNTDSVLFSCVNSLRRYFSETFYIGEPLYIAYLYENLNDVDGVISVNKVNVENKNGGQYSPIYMDFERELSRDGTYIKVPKNVILELKYPDLDIKGTAK